MSNNWLPLIRTIDAAIRCEDIRDVGFFLFTAGRVIVVFANSGVMAGRLKIILGKAPSLS